MKKFATICLLNLGIMGGMTNVALGENAATAPEELTQVVAGFTEAANKKDLDKVISYYSQEFKNSDGLTKDALGKALAQMWQNYPRLKYTTKIESWSKSGQETVAETLTTINGTQVKEGRQTQLNSTIRSRQYFQAQKLVRQEILTERSQISTGANPPVVEVSAPDTVKPGEKYNFDLIVAEPLAGQVLLGAVQEQKTGVNPYLNPASLELEPLAAGGIYKVATAPSIPENNWLSAILVRGDGMTMITHRVNIQDRQAK